MVALARFGLGQPSPTVQTHGWIPPCCGQIWLHSLIWPREARSGLPITRSPVIRFGWRQPDPADHDWMLLASVIVKGGLFFSFFKKGHVAILAMLGEVRLDLVVGLQGQSDITSLIMINSYVQFSSYINTYKLNDAFICFRIRQILSEKLHSETRAS